MSPALQAHLRLLQAIPQERIRTHLRGERRVPRPAVGQSRSRADTERLHHRIVAMKKAGAKHAEIISELQVSWTTVSKHLNGHIKGPRRAA